MSLPGPLMAVTVHMPWAWLLAAGYKPLENRNWVPKIVPVGAWMAIHAGMKFDPAEVQDIMDDLQDQGVLKVRREDRPLTLAMLMEQCGHILSVGRLDRIATQSDSRWFIGKYGWCFDPMVRLPTPVVHRGGQGLWPVNVEALAVVRAGFAQARVAKAAKSADSASPSAGEIPCP